MNNKQTTDNNKVEQTAEMNALMAAYNPEPPKAEQPARFYWQEPWQDSTADAADKAVQSAFEN